MRNWWVIWQGPTREESTSNTDCVYQILKEEKTVKVLRFWTHYE